MTQQTSSTSALKLNTEMTIFDHDDGTLLVHLPIRGYAFRAGCHSAPALRKLRAGKELTPSEAQTDVVAELNRIGALGYEQRPRPKTRALEQFEPVEATLIFTETCNLGCTYCYASSLPGKTKPMSREIAKAAIDTVLDNATRTKKRLASIRYIGGGEPTIAWDLLQWVTEYVKQKAAEKDVRYFIRLITNGTLLSDDRVEWLANNIQFVTLSFDILPELQGRNRPFANGRSTQERMLKTINLLGKHGVQFHLRTTISSEGAARLVEMVEYVHKTTPCATSIRFEPMAEIGRSSEADVSKPRQQEFVDSFKAAYRLGQSLGIDVTCKMFTNYKRRSTRFCNAEFSVTPSGVVSACHRYSREEHDGYDLFKIGEFDGTKFNFDIDKINAIRFIDNDSFEDCKTCFARWSCASGCLSARVSSRGISKSGPLCHLTRELLKFSIDEQLKKETEYV